MKILISLNKYEINLLLFCFQNVREKPCPNAGSWNALENTKSFTQLSPGVCPLSESEVTYGQVCQVPILGICALHLTYSKPFMLRRLRRCLAQVHLSRGIEGGESAVHSLPPPTIPAGPATRTHNLWVTSPTLYH